MSPIRKAVALTRPMMSPGKAVSSTARSRPKIAWAYFVANGRPVCACTATIPRSKTPEHTRAKATRSRWLVSIPACTLNTNALNGAATSRTCRGRPSAPSSPWRKAAAGGASSTSVSRSIATPKFEIAEANSTGVVKPLRNSSWSWSAPSEASSSASSTAAVQASPSRVAAAADSIRSSGARVAPPAVRV